MRMIVAMASIGLFSAVAFADGEMAAPRPSEEMKSLAKAMVGVWKCDGKSQMGGKEMTYKSKAIFTSELDGFVVAGRFEANGKVMARDVTSFDPATKTFTRINHDGWGGSSTGTSKGFEGGVMTWTGKGKQLGKDVEEEQTMTQKGPKQWIVTGTQKGPGPETMTYELTCKR